MSLKHRDRRFFSAEHPEGFAKGNLLQSDFFSSFETRLTSVGLVSRLFLLIVEDSPFGPVHTYTVFFIVSIAVAVNVQDNTLFNTNTAPTCTVRIQQDWRHAGFIFHVKVDSSHRASTGGCHVFLLCPVIFSACSRRLTGATLHPSFALYFQVPSCINSNSWPIQIEI